MVTPGVQATRVAPWSGTLDRFWEIEQKRGAGGATIRRFCRPLAATSFRETVASIFSCRSRLVDCTPAFFPPSSPLFLSFVSRCPVEAESVVHFVQLLNSLTFYELMSNWLPRLYYFVASFLYDAVAQDVYCFPLASRFRLILWFLSWRM